MQVIRSYDNLPDTARGASVAIGNFDGVHLGHRAVIDIARGWAEAQSLPLGVMTFEPHPRRFFAPQSPAFRLMSPEAKAHRLEKLGVDLLYELPFGEAIAALTPEAFARDMLHRGMGLRHVVVGANFRFGRDRAGDAEMLAAFGREMGFEVSIAPMLEAGAARISSTAIREALGKGRPRDAAQMLGHWHRIEGEVIGGAQRGRALGFPTANIALGDLHLPKFGVYAVEVDILTGPHAGSYHGAASLGTRPMFGDNAPNLETHIFDFAGDIYGAHISVALVDYLRAEQKFDSLEAFIDQMQADCARARSLLSAA